MSSDTIAKLLENLQQQGVELWFEGARLRFRARKGVLTAAQRAELSVRRDEVLAHLRQAAAGECDFPLSFSQRSLWFVNQLDPASAAYNVSFTARILSGVDVPALRQALQALVDRHATLRTTYTVVAGHPVQRVVGVLDVSFNVIDVAEVSDAALRSRVQDDYASPFHLEHGPVFRTSLYTRSEREHILLLNVHHIAADGWSLLLLVDELRALYAEATGGRAAALPRPEVSYTDFTEWQSNLLASDEGNRIGGFWKRQLAAPRAEIELPCDRTRPEIKSGYGQSISFDLSPELSASLRQLARNENVTLFVVILAAFKALLYRYSGAEDLIVGTPTFGRNRPEFAKVIGDFVNVVPLRTHLDAELPFREFLVRVRETLLGALDAQEYPLALMAERLQPSRDPSRSPFFEVLFMLQRFDQLKALEPVLAPTEEGATIDFGGLTLASYPIDQQEGQFDLTLQVVDRTSALAAQFKFNPDLFDVETITRLARHFNTLMIDVVTDPSTTVGALTANDSGCLCDREHQSKANNYTGAQTLHTRFEAQAAQTPNALAVTCEGVSISYAQLNTRANRLAHRLREQGVLAETLVGLCAERSIDLVVGVLGILKAGGAYLPIDLSYPADRVAFMLADANASVLVTQRSLQERLPVTQATAVLLDDDNAAFPDTNPDAPVAADNLMYVIYTSGSTGKPKGTLLTHRAVYRLMTATEPWYGFGPDDVWTLFHSAAFDFSVWELWGALAYGGRLIVVPFWVSRSPETFLELLHTEGVTVLNQTPSAFRQLVQADIASGAPRRTKLRYVIFGGEALELQSLRPWMERHGDAQPRLVNMYGITETCVHVTYRPITLDDVHAGLGSVIGVPIPDLHVHLLDAHLQPVPIGVAAEMYVGGPGLARGYLNRPELTDARFVPDPFSAGQRLYRTGDLARRQATGELEYLGRIDQQVKIRGFRIELGEIEAAIASSESVRQCVVVARADATLDKQLVAYIVADANRDAVLRDVRARLAEALPVYMVPTNFVLLDTLPLTANGKIDTAALPAPAAGNRRDATRAVVLESDTERALAAIWCEVLDRPSVSRDDNFFELGGQSLVVVTLLERMRRLGLASDVRTVFSTTTLAALAEAVGAARDTAVGISVPDNLIFEGATHISPEMLPLVVLSQAEIDSVVATVPDGAANVQDIYPLTASQQGILFHHQLIKDSEADTHLVRGIVAFESRERLDEFVEAVRKVVQRHDALRSAIVWEDLSQPVQVVYRQATLRVDEVTPPEGADTFEHLRGLTDPARRPLHLTRAPLVTAHIARVGDTAKWLLAMTFHHIIIDHVSIEVMNAEIAAILGENEASLATPPSFRRFVAESRRASDDEHKAFFRDMLGDLSESTLLSGLHVRGKSYDVGEAKLTLPAELARRVREECAALGMSSAVLFHVAWALVVARLTGRTDVTFGTVLLGRSGGSEGVDRVIGMLINTLPIRVEFAELTVVQVLRQAHERLSTLLLHEQASLAFAQRCSQVPITEPLFNTLFNFRSSGAAAAPFDKTNDTEFPGLRNLLGDGRTNFPFSGSVDDTGRSFVVGVQCPAGFDPANLASMMQRAAESIVSTLQHESSALARSLVASLPVPAQTEASPKRTIAEVLEDFIARDIRLSVDGERLKVTAPKGAVDDVVKATIADRRADLIAELRRQANAPSAGTSLKPVPRTARLPLSSAQQRLWFLDRMDPGSAHNNIGGAFWLRGVLRTPAFSRAVDALFARHESMRLRFDSIDGEPFVELIASPVGALEVRDVGGSTVADRPAEALRIAMEFINRPFDLATGPMARVLLVRVHDNEYLCCFGTHHAVSDGWSLAITMRDLFEFYNALVESREPTLKPLALQYADYAEWERQHRHSARMGEDLAFWKKRLAGAPSVIDLPTDRPRSAVPTFKGHRIKHTLDGEFLDALKGVARTHDVTLYMVLLASWQVLLSRLSGQTDVVIGSPVAGRDHQALEDVVGCFVNNLVMRATLEGNPTFAEFLTQVRRTTLDAFEHRDLPFDVLVEAVKPDRSISHSPVFQVLFALQSFPIGKANLVGLEVEFPSLETELARFDLFLELHEREGVLNAHYEYAADLFDAPTIHRLHAQFVQLLSDIVRDASTYVQDLALLTHADAQLSLIEWNDTAVSYNRDLCVHQLLEASARRTADAPAVVVAGATTTYGELDARANQLAHLLVAQGVRPGALVAVCLDRTADMPVALAAVLKTGGAYVPLDPTHPAERLQYTLGDAQVFCVITRARFASLLGNHANVFLLDELEAELAEQPNSALDVKVRTTDVAYVIYTSGSTGLPKGVQVEHGNMVSFLEAMRREPGFTERDSLLAVTTLSFDIAGLELWLPLSVGGRVVIASRADVLDGEQLIDLLHQYSITVMQATPSTWRLMLEAGWKNQPELTALCGGEALPRELAVSLVDTVGALWNMYGPTETTVWSTVSHIRAASLPIRIGHPIANTRVYILEPSGLPAPVGVAGELCIAGDGVARGYLNRPELTAEKFTIITLPDGRTERVYRTGDLARFHSDGQLEFIGRRDNQVKVRGYRIELGEIESVLATDPTVKACVVAVREDVPGDQRIVAYVVPGESAAFEQDRARTILRARLPEYMVPNTFLLLESLPLTPNGKIDRKALPAPDAPAEVVPEEFDSPMTPAQARVASIWRDVLRTPRVGLYDNFFDLGGHSLLLVKLHAALKREFTSDIPLVELFQRTTVAAQADRFSSALLVDTALQRAQERAGLLNRR